MESHTQFSLKMCFQLSVNFTLLYLSKVPEFRVTRHIPSPKPLISDSLQAAHMGSGEMRVTAGRHPSVVCLGGVGKGRGRRRKEEGKKVLFEVQWNKHTLWELACSSWRLFTDTREFLYTPVQPTVMHSQTCHAAGRQHKKHIDLVKVEPQDSQYPGQVNNWWNSSSQNSSPLWSTHFMSMGGSHSHSEQHPLKCWHLETSRTSPESISQAYTRLLLPAEAFSFTVGHQKSRKKMEVTWRYGLQKGQMSKEIINSTWATSAPMQWKGPRTNPRKGHWDQRSHVEKGNSEGLPALTGVNLVLITHQKEKGSEQEPSQVLFTIFVFFSFFKVKCSCSTFFQRDYFFLLLEHRKPRIVEIR